MLRNQNADHHSEANTTLITYCKNCGWKIVTPRDVVIPCPRCEGANRSERIKAKVAKSKRLESWVVFFRLANERGLGDTASRLVSVAGDRAIKLDLDQLLKTCGCEPQDAIEKLNDRHPYSS